MDTVLPLLLLGLAAGVLTTLAGQGGGLFLLLALGALRDPHQALALSSPALLLGNLHRAILCRRDVAWKIAGGLVLGAAPAAVLGGVFAGRLPAIVISAVLVLLTVFAISRRVFGFSVGVPARAFPVAGAVVGFLTGTSGGAGVLVSPLLLSAGLTARTFVGTAAVVSCAIHVGRVTSYAKTGLLHPEQAGAIACLTVAIFAGNALGDRLRRFFTERSTTRLELGTLVVCVLVSVLGLAR
jgi:uncharacterized membrane protein YfcA